MSDEPENPWMSVGELNARYADLSTRGEALQADLRREIEAVGHAYDKLNNNPLEELRQAHLVAPIITQFGTWAVTEYGVECLVDMYPIGKERLHEPGWVEHLSNKVWVVRADFKAALRAGRHRWPPADKKLFARDLETD